jgi:hypothetical protein
MVTGRVLFSFGWDVDLHRFGSNVILHCCGWDANRMQSIILDYCLSNKLKKNWKDDQ